MEKKSIIDEVFEESKIYLDEDVDMRVETLMENEKTPNACPLCSHSLEELYCRSKEEDFGLFNLVVLRCPGCKRVFAYHIMAFDYLREDLYGEDTAPAGPASLMRKERPEVPQKCASAYSKSVASIEAKDRQLFNLIQNKMAELVKAGLSVETVNLARSKAARNLKDPFTPKKVSGIAVAAVYVVGNGVVSVCVMVVLSFSVVIAPFVL